MLCNTVLALRLSQSNTSAAWCRMYLHVCYWHDSMLCVCCSCASGESIHFFTLTYL